MINGGIELHIENRLKHFRVKHLLSQEELAAAVGVSGNAISSYERGEYYPSLPVLLQMSFLFDVSPDALFRLMPDQEVAE